MLATVLLEGKGIPIALRVFSLRVMSTSATGMVKDVTKGSGVWEGRSQRSWRFVGSEISFCQLGMCLNCLLVLHMLGLLFRLLLSITGSWSAMLQFSLACSGSFSKCVTPISWFAQKLCSHYAVSATPYLYCIYCNLTCDLHISCRLLAAKALSSLGHH